MMSARERLAASLRPLRRAWHRFWRLVSYYMPKRLYARSLIIVITPMILLQSVVAFVFMERHWQTVTQRLSEAVTRDIAALVDMIDTLPPGSDYSNIVRLAGDRLSLKIDLLPPDPLPPPGPKPFFSILDRSLSAEITKQINRPFWIDTVGNSNIIEIRIQLDGKVLRVFARRSQAYAPNTYIFLTWMVGTSLVLLMIAVPFLRNQIKPIQRLADAAEEFGKGRPLPDDFHPSGAREVRQASFAFIEMSSRIEKQMEQRTTMLNGVSHDLRTILTRFRLQLALLPDSPETRDLTADVDEMQEMLEDYLSFARGDSGEASVETDITAMLRALASDAERAGHTAKVSVPADLTAIVRPNALKRCLTNLVDNACSFGDDIRITAAIRKRRLIVHVDDDGPGIPRDRRDDVFRPFVRLDDARNQDRSGTGLGLSIALDIARAHGGDIELSDNPEGGLRATLTIPV